MDYGPFLCTTLEAPQPPGNFAYKAIIIPLKPDRSMNVAFDTDLLRWSAGWEGGFIDWKCVAFDGSHEVHPSLVGHQVFGNAMTAGWARPGTSDFADPRVRPYGPLPREWAHWKGLYLYFGSVMLSYTVGDTEVLEMPGLLERNSVRAFTRTISVGASKHDLVLHICQSPPGVRGVITEGPQSITPSAPADSIVLLAEKDASKPASEPATQLAIGCMTDAKGLRWDSETENAISLRVPASEEPITFELLMARCRDGQVDDFKASLRRLYLPSDLKWRPPGGPSRWSPALTTRAEMGRDDGPFAVDTLTAPRDNPWHSWMRFGGFDFFPGGTRAAICTWNGDVWTVDGIDDTLDKLTWRRIATGLFQPLGLKIVDEQIYVLGRDQITRLHDLNGDGEADFYENFNNDHQVTDHFHEFAMDLQTAPDGDFYYMKAGRHGKLAVVPQHGTLIHVSRDGSRSEIVCNGFRAPNGLGIRSDGAMLTTDQEGYWMPMNRINWLRRGGFYGNMWALFEGPRPTKDDPPLCWVPNWLDRSPAAPVWVDSERWGPLKGELLTLSYGTGRLFHVLYEELEGARQGGLVPLPLSFDTGIIRGRFNPRDGQLYVCGLFGSWGSDRTADGGFHRVRYTGKPLYTPDQLFAIKPGMVMRFTDPLDVAAAGDPHNYLVECWNYKWTEKYGSDDFRVSDGAKGRDRLPVTGVKVSRDGRSVFLQIPGLRPCMQMQIKYNIRAADGASISQAVVNTIHVLGEPERIASLPGMEFEGGLSPPPPAGPEHLGIENLRPGMALRFALALRSRDIESEQPLDARIARMIALNVPEAEPATPFMPPGVFSATWEGYVQTDLAEEYTFHAEGRGRFILYVNGTEVIPPGNLPLTSKPVKLRGGLNGVRARFIGDAREKSGGAGVRLYWSSAHLPRAPVPPTALFHDPRTAGLDAYRRLHQGRELFATRHCLRCHQPDSMPELKDAGMIELSADAPALAGIGSRLSEDWIARWLLDPHALRSDATMPKLLHGGEARQQALDIAAWLGTLKEDEAPTASGKEGDVKRGEILFDALGCVGCHLPPGKLDATFDRVPLLRVKDKWNPGALREFLRQPERHHPWTRMPNFKLSESEAADLTRFLLSRPNAPMEKITPSRSTPDAGRGQKLVSSMGCLRCHPMKLPDESTAPALSAIQHGDWTHGCMAETPDARGRAPDFAFSETEREALSAFARTDMASLQRNEPAEFAQRQIAALRCTACHSLDGAADTWSEIAAHIEDPIPIEQIAAALGREQFNDYQGRPMLTWAGEKLHADWMSDFIAGRIDSKPRPGLLSRMPAWPAYAPLLAKGLAIQHGLDGSPESEPPLDKEAVAIGEKLIDTGAFSCTTCHGVGAKPPIVGSTLQAINLDAVHRRMRKEFYRLWILDPQRIEQGTMMPRFMEDDLRSPFKEFYAGDGGRQIDAIWQYMRSLDRSR